MYSIVISFSLILTSVTGELNLEILSNNNGLETSLVSSLVLAESDTNLTLICRTIDTKRGGQFDNHTIWGRNPQKLKFPNVYDSKSLMENTIATGKLDFSHVSLKDEGEYFCASPKYKIFKIVYVTITPKMNSAMLKDKNRGNRGKRSTNGSESRNSGNNRKSNSYSNQDQDHVVYVSNDFMPFHIVILVVLTLLAILIMVICYIKFCRTYDPNPLALPWVTKRHRFGRYSSTVDSSVIVRDDDALPHSYSTNNNIHNHDGRVMHDLDLPPSDHLTRSDVLGRRILVVDDSSAPPSYEEVTRGLNIEYDGFSTRVLNSSVADGCSLPTFYVEAEPGTNAAENCGGATDNSYDGGAGDTTSYDCGGGGDTTSSYDCGGGGDCDGGGDSGGD